MVHDENRQIKKNIIDMSTRKRRKIVKKKVKFDKKLTITQFCIFFRVFFIKKIFFISFLKRLDDYLKRRKIDKKMVY